MKFELEREAKWSTLKQETEVTYWIKVDGKYVELSRTYEDALAKWENLKAKYQPANKKIIEVLEVDEEDIKPIVETLKTEEVNENKF
jgi:hypothetical protein